MGRNTGNRVSNAIFGDKWSSPYRVAVDGGSGKPRRGGNRRPQSCIEQESCRNNGRPATCKKAGNGKWLYWLGAIILFCGTYNAIINPNYEDIVLVIMLWIVAIVIFIVKAACAKAGAESEGHRL